MTNDAKPTLSFIASLWMLNRVQLYKIEYLYTMKV
jgi:hypothetical protein